MAKIYYDLILKKLLSPDDVPFRWREATKILLHESFKN